METRMAPAGTVIRLEQTGGGYGNPFTRPRELVLRDVEDGYVSPEMASKQYGCDLPGLLQCSRMNTGFVLATIGLQTHRNALYCLQSPRWVRSNTKGSSHAGEPLQR